MGMGDGHRICVVGNEKKGVFLEADWIGRYVGMDRIDGLGIKKRLVWWGFLLFV